MRDNYRQPGADADLPVLVWPDDDGNMIVQIGRGRPFQSWRERIRFARFVTDEMWSVEPITAAEYHAALGSGTWPDGRKAWEQN